MTVIVADAQAVPAPGWRTGRSWNYQLGRLVVTRYWVCQLFVMALMATNVFWRLPSTAISSMDEARYGVAASEMLSARALLVPTYGGQTEYWNLKPPLGYWLIEASYSVFGRTVWGLRLTSALCALAVVGLTMAFCRRSFGRRAAILAGLIVTTCFGFLSNHGARSGDLDAALTLLLLLALMQVPALRQSATSRLAFGLLLALAFLLKSFAIVPFTFAAIIYLVWTGGERVPWRQWLPAVAVFVGIVGGWAVMRTIKDGTAYFVIRMTYEDLLMRSTHEIDIGTYAPWGYATALVDRFAPWPVLILLSYFYAGPRMPAGRYQHLRRLLLLWALLPLGLFSLAQTQHHWYLDPTYPALAILAAVAVLSMMKGPKTQWGRGALLCMTVLGVMACEVRLFERVEIRDRRPGSQQFLASLSNCLKVRGEPLYTTFTLSHSERFILQVMDGFDVREPEVAASNTLVAATPVGLILDRSAGAGASTGSGSHQFVISNPAIMAQGSDYVLVASRGSAAITPGRLLPDVSGSSMNCPGPGLGAPVQRAMRREDPQMRGGAASVAARWHRYR